MCNRHRPLNYLPGSAGELSSGVQDCGLGRPVRVDLPWPKENVPYVNTVRTQVWKKYARYFFRSGKPNPLTDHAKDLEYLIEVPCKCVMVIAPPNDEACSIYHVAGDVIEALIDVRVLSNPDMIYSLFVRRGGRHKTGRVFVKMEEVGL